MHTTKMPAVRPPTASQPEIQDTPGDVAERIHRLEGHIDPRQRTTVPGMRSVVPPRKA